MASVAEQSAPPHPQVHVSFKAVHFEVPASPSPHFTIEALQPFTCAAATLSVNTSVAVRSTAQSAGQQQQQQQQTPLGTRRSGQISVTTTQPDGTGTSVTSTLSLYEALVGYRRPNKYMKRPALCIVDNRAAKSQRRQPYQRPPPRLGRLSGAALEEKSEVRNVSFVDLSVLTANPHAVLRCPSTGEVLVPTPLYCSFPTGSASGAPAAATSSPGKALAGKTPTGSAHAPHHRRRVVLLPLSASGDTYELVLVYAVPERGAEGTH